MFIYPHTPPRADVQYLRLIILRAIYEAQKTTGDVTLDEVAEIVRCHRNTVQRHVAALRDSKYITVTRTKPYRYEFTEKALEVLEQ